MFKYSLKGENHEEMCSLWERYRWYVHYWWRQSQQQGGMCSCLPRLWFQASLILYLPRYSKLSFFIKKINIFWLTISPKWPHFAPFWSNLGRMEVILVIHTLQITHTNTYTDTIYRPKTPKYHKKQRRTMVHKC